MSKFAAAAKKFVREEEGATLVEYGLLVALLAVVCIGVITTLGTDVKAMFTNISIKIASAKTAG